MTTRLSELPDVVRARLASMLSPLDRDLFASDMKPNNATVLLSRGTYPFPLPDVSEDADWIHAEVVANKMVVRADFWMKDDTIASEHVSALDVMSILRVEVSDTGGTLVYSDAGDDTSIGVDAATAAAVIGARRLSLRVASGLKLLD